ncbi:AAA family ATPase [Macrococcoides canis]|uniref:AAA family ATPase n=1 Tax=Macrococcoides canis TaxID=1855823 RepID=UPI00207CB8AF|nr:AAA family ATPase [Macrococcus canis]MCO4097336.1 AAA family ATPase [Macrococcus canis]UTH09108.1 AAA family ATPase [Macrococcus canis]
MIIKKILLSNFKNFREQVILDFSSDVNFLVGPNGFGKTTIFDAIELGITGELVRIKANEKITPENEKYKKPFFQNNENEPVIIKVYLLKENGDRLIIVRKFDEVIDKSKRDFAPIASFKKIELFKQIVKTDSDFDKNDVDLFIKIEQREIDDFLGFKNDYDIKNVFNLFNYIQQEETTFFLKQNEQQRSDKLSFLLKTDKIEEKVKKIKKVNAVLDKEIKSTIEKQRGIVFEATKSIEYKKLFLNRDFKFDSSIPFTNDIEELDTFREKIQEIIEFKKLFSIKDYRIKLEKEYKIKHIENDPILSDTLFYLLLEPLLIDRTWEKEKYALENSWLFEYVLLEDYMKNFDVVLSDHNRKKQLNLYLTILSSDIERIHKYSFQSFENRELSEDSKLLKILITNYYEIRNLSNEIDRGLIELINLRKELEEKYNKTHLREVSDKNCPFCNTEFQSYTELMASYKDYENYLMAVLSNRSKEMQIKRGEINSLISDMKDKINNELDSLVVDVEDEIIDKMKSLRTNVNDNIITQFKMFLLNYIEISPLEYGSLSFQTFESELSKQKSNFLLKLPFENEVYNFINSIAKDKFEAKSVAIREEFSKFDFHKFKIIKMSNSKISMRYLENQIETIKKQLVYFINNKYEYNENSIKDPNNILYLIFSNDLQLLESISLDDLENKKYYIETKASSVQTEKYMDLENKVKELSSIKNQLNITYNFYNEEIKKYKVEMIKKLRIPFFIYSSKILQNYQQGLGVFLSFKKDFDNIEEKSIVKFMTNSNNNHDAMYQLSTGQLAAISLAFTLSLNTMFKLSDDLNFLMIDDPIQDMDSLNVLSFIEILRHSIIGKYQVILSTYNDQNALFMAYKFSNTNEKIDLNFENVRDLQYKIH